MNKTLRISFSLKNTYRVNAVLYSIKQIPLLKKVLPNTLYRAGWLKIFANILSGIWELISAFGGKILYLLFMIFGAAVLYGESSDALILHLLIFLSVIGAFTNTYMFNPSRDKYYGMMLMRMDARDYTLVNYSYSIIKLIIGFMPFILIFGLRKGMPIWMCLLIPFFIAGLKLNAASISLKKYKKTGIASNENQLGKAGWAVLSILLACAYGLPLIGAVLPVWFSVTLMILGILGGIFSIHEILSFKDYRDMYQQILSQSMNLMADSKEAAKLAVRQQSQKAISADRKIVSRKKGFEFLNELFIKRHQRILWRSAKRIAGISVCLFFAVLIGFYLMPDIKLRINRMLLTFLPYFVFIMYFVNRGTGFTQALFMNCDHSLLTYSFYKRPGFVLKLFRIRLREIIKINMFPAAVIGGGLTLILYISGGTDNLLNYAALLISILCMSIFFSVHYLTVYYLLQPYNVGTEMRSGTYRIVLSLTYVVCFMMTKLKMPTLVFGGMTIVFCILYSVIACILVYRFAPKTFRLRL